MKAIFIKILLILLRIIGGAVVLYIGAVIVGYGAALGVMNYLSYLEKKKTQNYLKMQEQLKEAKKNEH